MHVAIRSGRRIQPSRALNRWRLVPIYDWKKKTQHVEWLMEIHKRGDGDEDGIQEFTKKMKFKADIIVNAEIFARDGRDTFLELYYQEPEKVLEYSGLNWYLIQRRLLCWSVLLEKHGFHIVNRLLEYHANLLLNEREITPEVEEEHVRFIRMLFLSNYSSLRLDPAFLAKEGTYRYWRVVQNTMDADSDFILRAGCRTFLRLLSCTLTIWFLFLSIRWLCSWHDTVMIWYENVLVVIFETDTNCIPTFH